MRWRCRHRGGETDEDKQWVLSAQSQRTARQALASPCMPETAMWQDAARHLWRRRCRRQASPVALSRSACSERLRVPHGVRTCHSEGLGHRLRQRRNLQCNGSCSQLLASNASLRSLKRAWRATGCVGGSLEKEAGTLRCSEEVEMRGIVAMVIVSGCDR